MIDLENFSPEDEFVRLLIEEAPAAIAVLDKNMHYLAYSKRWLEDFKIEQSNILGMSHYDCFPDLKPQWREQHKSALKGNYVTGEEEKFIRLDGGEVWMKRKYIPWKTVQGEIGGIIILNEVTTERNQLETAKRELEDKNKALEYSTRFQKLMLDNYPDYIFIKDDKYRIMMANENFIRLYPEEKRDMVIGYTTFEEYLPDDVEKFLAKDKEAFEQGKSEIIESINFPDGRMRTLYTQKIRFEGHNGLPHILGIAQDVTEREALINTLEAKNEELSAFAYRTSHDLKSPLVTMRRLAEYIINDLKSGQYDEANKNLDTIKQQTHKLESLVTDILDLTRSEQQESSFIDINLNQVIDEITERYAEMIRLKGVKVYSDVEPLIHSDVVRVKQILENLVVNAIKYSSDETEESFVKVILRDGGNQYLLKVEDNGIGIDPDVGDKIYKAFTRFDKKSDGSGLGLAIVKKHVNKLGGNINYESSEIGTIFSIVLPKQDNESRCQDIPHTL